MADLQKLIERATEIGDELPADDKVSCEICELGVLVKELAEIVQKQQEELQELHRVVRNHAREISRGDVGPRRFGL